ncbi:MAG: hypothetical protein ACE5FA_08135 [Dehalococcoidia bacterium]
MNEDTRAPTLAHDIRALADLYLDLARLMARRLTHPSRWDRYQFYGPIEMIRPDEEAEPEELARS